MVEANKNNMIYRYLGRTGVKVSILSHGNFFNSEKDEQFYTSSIKRCLDYGINFFDTAEGYDHGHAEEVLGKAFKDLAVRREDIVVATKLFFFQEKPGITVNDVGLSRKHVIQGAKASLRRLQLEYVDIIYAHRPDPLTPMEEVCRAFDWLIRKGYSLYWGTSEWSPAEITDAISFCREKGLSPPVAEQAQYNVLIRDRFESEYRILFEKYGYGITTFSPLCCGLLTGKYNDGNIPEKSRYSDSPFMKTYYLPVYFGEHVKEKNMKILQGLGAIAKDYGFTQAQLALAWIIVNTDVSSAIVGYGSLEQIDENMKALELAKKWNAELEQKIEALIQNQPAPPLNFRSFSFFEQRRTLALMKND